MNYMNEETIDLSDKSLGLSAFFTKVYGWMSFALLLTAITAYFVASSDLLITIIMNRMLYIGLVIGELFLVGFLTIRIHKMNVSTAAAVFILYSILNGLTLSVIFFVYTMASITSVFFITAGVFGAMSLYGYVTKRDLTTLGQFSLMGLFGIIIASLVNIFLQSEMIYWISTYIGVIVFVGLTAYDTAKLKNMYYSVEGAGNERRLSIYGALSLYLDFINLFIMLLRIFGKKR